MSNTCYYCLISAFLLLCYVCVEDLPSWASLGVMTGPLPHNCRCNDWSPTTELLLWWLVPYHRTATVMTGPLPQNCLCDDVSYHRTATVMTLPLPQNYLCDDWSPTTDLPLWWLVPYHRTVAVMMILTTHHCIQDTYYSRSHTYQCGSLAWTTIIQTSGLSCQPQQGHWSWLLKAWFHRLFKDYIDLLPEVQVYCQGTRRVYK